MLKIYQEFELCKQFIKHMLAVDKIDCDLTAKTLTKRKNQK